MAKNHAPKDDQVLLAIANSYAALTLHFIRQAELVAEYERQRFRAIQRRNEAQRLRARLQAERFNRLRSQFHRHLN